MTPAELLGRLARRGARLTVTPEGGLRFHGPERLLVPRLLGLLREHRAALLDLLARRSFTRAELRALGFLGEPDGAGRYVVRVRGEERGVGSGGGWLRRAAWVRAGSRLNVQARATWAGRPSSPRP